MTQTKKFSQFQGPNPIAVNDIVVGLRIDPLTGLLDNWQFTGVGSGGGGGSTGVTTTITQPNHGFTKGKWLRVDVATQIYVLAQSDTVEHAEVIGVVIDAPTVNTFVLQQSGYITSAQAVVAGLTIGEPQFLSVTSPGDMQPTDVIVDGQISRPVFIPDGVDKGWVVPYRGIITDGGPNTGGGGGPTPPATDPNIIVVTQNNHGFHQGDVLYVIPPVGGQATYALAKADNFVTSNAVGVVISPDPQAMNSFTLQFSGYNLQTASVSGITVDDLGFPVVASTVYYLSATDAGKVSSIFPMVPGTFSRPVFISERTALTSALYAGWILPQRPLGEEDADNPLVHTVTQAHNFHIGQWVFIDTVTQLYQLAQADTLARAQVAGLVVWVDSSPGNSFMVQQSGWVNNVINTGTYIDGGLAPTVEGTVYYLSIGTAGNISVAVPGVGQVSKPCYVQEKIAGFVGEVLPQRPLIVANPVPPGGGAIQLIGSFNFTNQTTLTGMENILNGTYTDVWFTGRNIVIQRTSPGAPIYFAAGLYYRYCFGGAPASDLNYASSGAFGLGFPRSTGLSVVTENGPSSTTPSGCSPLAPANFELYLPDTKRNGTYKASLTRWMPWKQTVLAGPPAPGYNQGSSFGEGYEASSSSSNPMPVGGGVYYGSLAPVTGITVFVDGTGLLPAPTVLLIVSAEISVYGRLA